MKPQVAKFESVPLDKATSYSCREWSSRSSDQVAVSRFWVEEVAKSRLLQMMHCAY